MGESSSATQKSLRFGLFELDVRTGELRRDGRLIPLQNQPLQLLVFLVEHPNVIVTREEIRQKLWPQDMFVEFDDSVNHAVRKIREALGDTAGSPRFLETVPRQGYRFIAPVGPATAEIESTTRPVCKTRWSRWTAWTAVIGAVLLVTGLIMVRRSQSDALQVQSLAVLPLENLSGDPGQEYYSDGITEAVITELGQVPGIRVISHRSVKQFKSGGKPLPDIARELGVDALVEGSVVRHGGRVRVTAQLVAVNPERHVWAASYEREAGDVIGVQREVANAVAHEIRARLNQPAIQTVRQVNSEALR